MKKFLLSNVVFGTITILLFAYTIYEIFTREEYSVISIIITLVYLAYLFAYVKKHNKK